jgi:uncharacterized membrane protein YgdD (TMEM256/DUF423 family)
VTDAASRSPHAWQTAAGLSGFIAVVAGAVTAHAVPDPGLQKLAETASYWQLIHAVVLLWLAAADRGWLRIARWLMFAGSVLFCCTLYLKAFGVWPAATAAAPLGGTCFILGWLVIGVDGVLCLIRR